MKRNLVKELKEEYSTAKKCKLLDVSPALYLAVDGKGGPGGASFADAVGGPLRHGLHDQVRLQGPRR